ncbi:MAG: molybdopterin dinucleotide binding domain-containing protein [Syntrophales bacterium]|nr:molybdopterin dinucleotide binding domain-containing protein [Syntrophales bacterium]
MTSSGSGKVDLCLDHPKIPNLQIPVEGIPPLPVYNEPTESPISTPELYKEYPLVLTTGARNIVYFHSAHRNIPSLRKLSPDPQLDIHPETAKAFNVAEGEWVWLKTKKDKVAIRIRFDENIHPKVVSAPHGYWYGVKDGWELLNINMVTGREPQCPVAASSQTRALLCTIEKIDQNNPTPIPSWI